MATGETSSQQPTPIAEIQELLAAALPDPSDELAVQTCVEYLFSPQPRMDTVEAVADQLQRLKGRYVASFDVAEPPYKPKETALLSLLLMNRDEGVPTIFELSAMSRDPADTPIRTAAVFKSALRTMIDKLSGDAPATTNRTRHRHRPARAKSEEPERTLVAPVARALQQGNVPLVTEVRADDHADNIRRLHQQKGFTAEDIASMYDFDLDDIRRLLGTPSEQ